ncbi:hypothetical protein C7S16_0506 [Burkholderia thailandensis]|uniref:Uncharacterized protein n=1 Tax=Burkholderia thailandensis TaxID=57975 RepID=A0AAW9CY97_BURTH|nr:hypothetical protein [Burkholderia thailandensis]
MPPDRLNRARHIVADRRTRNFGARTVRPTECKTRGTSPIGAASPRDLRAGAVARRPANTVRCAAAKRGTEENAAATDEDGRSRPSAAGSARPHSAAPARARSRAAETARTVPPQARGHARRQSRDRHATPCPERTLSF